MEIGKKYKEDYAILRQGFLFKGDVHNMSKEDSLTFYYYILISLLYLIYIFILRV